MDADTLSLQLLDEEIIIANNSIHENFETGSKLKNWDERTPSEEVLTRFNLWSSVTGVPRTTQQTKYSAAVLTEHKNRSDRPGKKPEPIFSSQRMRDNLNSSTSNFHEKRRHRIDAGTTVHVR